MRKKVGLRMISTSKLSKSQGHQRSVASLWCGKQTHQRIVGGEQVTAGVGQRGHTMRQEKKRLSNKNSVVE